VIVAPPLDAGAVNVTVTVVPVTVAVPIVGAPGVDICVTLGLGILALLVATMLLATTLNV
jgi:hypothetical protein